jgi:hypothetical protein
LCANHTYSCFAARFFLSVYISFSLLLARSLSRAHSCALALCLIVMIFYRDVEMDGWSDLVYSSARLPLSHRSPPSLAHTTSGVEGCLYIADSAVTLAPTPLYLRPTATRSRDPCRFFFNRHPVAPVTKCKCGGSEGANCLALRETPPPARGTGVRIDPLNSPSS